MSSSRLLAEAHGRVLIGASILSADFGDLARDTQAALDAGADLVHVDVMDGHFAPNLSMGPAINAALRQSLPDAFLDVHLMVTDPEAYVDPFADAGADHVTFHIEVVPDIDDVIALIDRIHGRSMSAGIAINPPTDVQTILPVVEYADLLLVMSVNPGFSGQAFIPEVLEKVTTIAGQLTPRQRLQIDGGVKAQNAQACRQAGCDVLVAASAIFGSEAYQDAIQGLRGVPESIPNGS
jgi:ribulose-phosphate 3-epimerase